MDNRRSAIRQRGSVNEEDVYTMDFIPYPLPEQFDVKQMQKRRVANLTHC